MASRQEQATSRVADEERLARQDELSSITLELPPDNPEIQKVQHNKTIENYIKLVLETAEQTERLKAFCNQLTAKLQVTKDKKLAKDCLLIWAPAAEVAGLYQEKQVIENIAFEILFPHEFKKVNKAYADLGGDEALQDMLNDYIELMQDVLEEDLDQIARDCVVIGRKKSPYSVWRKCYKKGQEDFRLPDFFGIRILIGSNGGYDETGIGVCYAVAGVVSQYFENDLKRLKSYVDQPKPNGYRSLHLTLKDLVSDAPIELQVRTLEMHEQAERAAGVSHMAYEAASKYTPGTYEKIITPRLYRWRDQAAHEVRQRQLKGDNSLENLIPGKILAFAPDGNLYELNEGNVALDFAFAVHSDTALRTAGIKIDGHPVRFSVPIEYGSVVAVEYAAEGTTTAKGSWLQLVNSSKASAKLKRAVRQGKITSI